MFKRSIETLINKIINLFSNDKTYDLGELQKKGYISNLPDMSACPKCKSKNVAWKFYIPVDGSKPTQDSISFCQDCGYKDKRGGFEKTNQAIFREEKINQILNEL